MISYDKYQNRIKRVATVKNFIVRFRALFIALFALLIAGSLALIFTKGTITQQLILPDKIIYGDNYGESIQPPKAFLSNVEYQFKPVAEGENAKAASRYSVAETEVTSDDGWTYELPTLAGKYLVRTVSDKITGKSYSTPKEFEIERYSTEFIINSDSIVYGELPDSYTFNLVNGDRLIVEGLKLDYDNPANDISSVCANADSFVILNSKGEDVTFCYDIAVPVKEDVNILSQDVTLTPESIEVEYNGIEVDYEIPVFKLDGGDAHVDIKIYDEEDRELSGNPKNAGTYRVEIVPDSTVVLNGEADVTKHYSISYEQATIKINRRPLSVATESGTKEYDGKLFIMDTVEEEGLLEIHHAVRLFRTDIIDADKYINECVYTVLDENEEDVTDNYAIEFNFGNLEITPRIINISTHDFNKIYDGTPFDETPYSVQKEGDEALVSGHITVPVYNYSDYIVGTYVNEFSVYIVDDSDNDVTHNYEISYEYGTLEIFKREISVTSATDSWIYDGNAHSNEEITLALLSELGEIKSALADGDEISVIECTEVTLFTAGIENAILCSISRDGDDVTENYDIQYIWGTLSIEKRALVITTPSIPKVYDGTPLLGTEVESSVDNLALCDILGEALTVASIIDCGKAENKTHFGIMRKDGEEDKTDNYDITYIYGTLEVTVRDITVATPTLKKVYDGTPLMGDGEVPELTDIDYHEYRPFDAAQITNAGEATNNTQYKIFRLEEDGEKEVTENFNINYEYGTLIVNRRRVYVYTATAEKEYDGTPLVCAEGWAGEEIPENDVYSLIEGHILKVDESEDKKSTSITDIGSIPNMVYFKVYSGEIDVSQNYELLYTIDTLGTLTVTPRIVLVTTADDNWIYDAEIHSNGSATTVHGSIAEDGSFVTDDKADFVLTHRLSLLYKTEVINAGTYENICAYEVVDENGESVNANYYLIIEYGTLTIDARPIIITTHSDNRVYDDTPFTCISAEAEEYSNEAQRGIIDGHEIVHDNGQFTASVTYATEGKVENELHYRIFSEFGEVTENYAIEYVYGEIFVTERPITIVTATSHAEFDGQPYFDVEGYNIEGEYGILPDHELVAVTYATVTFVTENEVSNEVVYRIEKNGTDLSENYKIKYEYGLIWRTVRYIRITTNDNIWTYDGEWHSDTTYTDEHLTDGEPDGKAGLVLGHKLTVIATPTEVRDYTEIPVENIVTYIVEDEEINENYDLSMVYGYLSISKRPIIITTATKDKVYDGDPFSYTADWHVGGGEVGGVKLSWGLVKGHGLAVVEIKAEITDVLWENGEISGIPNVVVYKVVDENGSDEVDKNYEIVDYIYGTLSRTPRPIIIYTDDAEKVYDGTPLECETFRWELCNEENTRGLLEIKGHKAVLDESFTPASITYIRLIGSDRFIDSTTNERHYLIENSDGFDISYNYEISYEYGTLTILHRPLTITTATRDWDYDGQYHYGEVSGEPASMAEFDNLVQSEVCYAIEESIANVIDYTSYIVNNTTQYQIFTDNAKIIETTYCYEINYEKGTLSINKINLVITTLSRSKVYDGDTLKGDDEVHDEADESYIAPKFDGLVEGDYYSRFFVSTLTDCGSKLNQTSYHIFAKRDGYTCDTKNNYNLSYIFGTLTVTQREITIKTQSKSHEYDGEEFTYPHEWEDIGVLKLVKDHTLEVTEIIGKITDVLWENGEIVGVENKVIYKVVDGSGSDEVNKNYIINYEYGTLTVIPRNILVTTKSNSWVYDAQEHFDDRYEKAVHIDGDGNEDNNPLVLIDTHALVAIEGTATIVVNYTAVKVTNEVKFVVMKGSVDVTGNYNIQYTEGDLAGKLEIKKRPVTITTHTKENEYNGEAFKYTFFDTEEFNLANNSGIVSIHKAVQVGEDISSVTYVHEGKVDNIFTVKIVDLAGNEYSLDGFEINENYAIKYKYGTISITPHKITVTNPTLTKPYDGKMLFGNDETIFEGKLFVDDYCVADKIAEIIDVGSIENNTSYIIKNADGTDITDSYEIEYTIGSTLTITKIGLTITTATSEKVYDGNPLRGDDGRYGKPEFSGKVDGETYKSHSVSEITDVGSVTNTTEYYIFAWRDGKEVETTGNYDIEYIEGTLTVTQREIKIQTQTKEHVYDGKEFTYPYDWKDVGELKLVKDHTLEIVEVIGKITDVLRDGQGEIIGVENKVIYKVVDGLGNDAVNKNYIIEYDYGELIILPREITVTTATDTKEYDGSPMTNIGGTKITAGSLADGQELVLDIEKAVPSATYVTDGKVKNELAYFVYADGIDVTENYDITYIYGTLTITPRKLTILLNTVESMVYGDHFSGYPYENGMYSYAEGSKHTVEGETLEIEIKYQCDGRDIADTSKLNSGKYDVVLGNAKIVNGDIKNYEVSVVKSSFNVDRRKITINLLEDEEGGKLYDGHKYAFDLQNGFEVIEGNIIDGDSLSIAVKYLWNERIEQDALNAGHYAIVFDEAGCTLNGDVELALNYKITCIINSVTYDIAPRPLVFVLKDLTHEYTGVVRYDYDDDNAMTFDDNQLADTDRLYEVSATTLLGGEIYSAIEVGEYDYKVYNFKVVLKDDEKKDVSQNYYLSDDQPNAKITITPRVITISVYFDVIASRDYTGKEIDLIAEYPDYGPYISAPVSEMQYSWGIYPGDLEKIQAVFTFTKNGESANLIELGTYTVYVSLQNKWEYDALRNYEIYSSYTAEFEITQRRINVIAEMTADRLVYNGEKIDTRYLSYYTKHYFTNNKGFIYDSDADDYQAVYSLYELGSDNSVNLIDDILQAGTYYLKVEISFVGSGVEQYLINELIDSEPFVVEQRTIYANTPDDDTAYIYNKTAAKTPEEFSLYYFDGEWKTGGFVNNDGDGAVPQFMYYKDGFGYESAVDAGEFLIKITGFGGPNSEYIARNYYVVLDAIEAGVLAHGKIIIKPATLIITPVDYTEKFNGRNEIIALSPTSYSIRYLEGSGDLKLFGSDKLSVKASGTANIRKSLSARVTLTSVRVSDDERDDITYNYDIIYNYDQFKAIPDKEIYPEEVQGLKQFNFAASVTFEQMKLYIIQPKAPVEFRDVEYGTNVAVTPDNPVIPIENIRNSNDLFYGHTVVISTARVVATEMSGVKQWINRCRVLDGNGNDISLGYEIIIEYDDDSLIKVHARELVIKVNFARGERADGYTLVTGDYEIIKGSLVYGAIIEITVQNGECVANIKTRMDEDHNDRYIVNFQYSNENYVKEAGDASRIYLLLSRRAEIIRKDDLSE